MAYIVDHANNTLLDDEPKKVGKLTPKQHKQMMNYLVRKKDAVPPKTETIKKFKNGGSLNELGERLEDMYDLYDNDKPLSASREKYLREKYFPKPFNNNANKIALIQLLNVVLLFLLKSSSYQSLSISELLFNK